jgi:anti-sigma B factor antagonist
MPLKVDRTTQDSGVELFTLNGSLTLGREAQAFEWSVEELIKSGTTRIVLDMTNISFVDSAGIGILVGCHGKVSAAGGQLRLAAVNGRVMNVLKITKVDSIMLTDASVADSVKAITAG